MASVEEQIRERINEARKNAQRRAIDADEERDERLAKLADDAEQMADAVLAVLNYHRANEDGECISCLDWTEYDDGRLETWWPKAPCDTARKIAAGLGIEADDA